MKDKSLFAGSSGIRNALHHILPFYRLFNCISLFTLLALLTRPPTPSLLYSQTALYIHHILQRVPHQPLIRMLTPPRTPDRQPPIRPLPINHAAISTSGNVRNPNQEAGLHRFCREWHLESSTAIAGRRWVEQWMLKVSVRTYVRCPSYHAVLNPAIPMVMSGSRVRCSTVTSFLKRTFAVRSLSVALTMLLEIVKSMIPTIQQLSTRVPAD